MGMRIAPGTPGPYCGVKEDFRELHRTFTYDVSDGYEKGDWIGVPFVLVDLPFSTVYDTLMLPVDLSDSKKEKASRPSLQPASKVIAEDGRIKQKLEEIEKAFQKGRLPEAKDEKELRDWAEANPQNIWADDALYVLLELKTSEIEKIPEYEYLIKTHPDLTLEKETQEQIPLIMPNPKVPAISVVKFDLCLAYRKANLKDQMQSCCTTLPAIFPEIKKQFLEEKFNCK
jgi:uncharacterized protein YceK